MLRRKIIIACLFLIASCAKKAPLSQDKMAEVMTDVMMMESENAINYNSGLLPDSLWEKDYAAIFNKHAVSRDEFKSAVSFYHDHPGQFSVIMEKVITRLQKMQLKSQSDRH